MTIDSTIVEQLRREPGMPDLDLTWLDPGNAERLAAKPGKRGLTLDEINVGAYGDAPDISHHGTTRVRGARPRPGVVRTGHFVPEKSDIWSENATLMYEEAVQRQWS